MEKAGQKLTMLTSWQFDLATGPKGLTRVHPLPRPFAIPLYTDLLSTRVLNPSISISLFQALRYTPFNLLTVKSLQVRLACVDQLPCARIEFIQDILKKQEKKKYYIES